MEQQHATTPTEDEAPVTKKSQSKSEFSSTGRCHLKSALPSVFKSAPLEFIGKMSVYANKKDLKKKREEKKESIGIENVLNMLPSSSAAAASSTSSSPSPPPPPPDSSASSTRYHFYRAPHSQPRHACPPSPSVLPLFPRARRAVSVRSKSPCAWSSYPVVNPSLVLVLPSLQENQQQQNAQSTHTIQEHRRAQVQDVTRQASNILSPDQLLLFEYLRSIYSHLFDWPHRHESNLRDGDEKQLASSTYSSSSPLSSKLCEIQVTPDELSALLPAAECVSTLRRMDAELELIRRGGTRRIMKDEALEREEKERDAEQQQRDRSKSRADGDVERVTDVDDELIVPLPPPPFNILTPPPYPQPTTFSSFQQLITAFQHVTAYQQWEHYFLFRYLLAKPLVLLPPPGPPLFITQQSVSNLINSLECQPVELFAYLQYFKSQGTTFPSLFDLEARVHSVHEELKRRPLTLPSPAHDATPSSLHLHALAFARLEVWQFLKAHPQLFAAGDIRASASEMSDLVELGGKIRLDQNCTDEQEAAEWHGCVHTQNNKLNHAQHNNTNTHINVHSNNKSSTVSTLPPIHSAATSSTISASSSLGTLISPSSSSHPAPSNRAQTHHPTIILQPDDNSTHTPSTSTGTSPSLPSLLGHALAHRCIRLLRLVLRLGVVSPTFQDLLTTCSIYADKLRGERLKVWRYLTTPFPNHCPLFDEYYDHLMRSHMEVEEYNAQLAETIRNNTHQFGQAAHEKKVKKKKWDARGVMRKAHEYYEKNKPVGKSPLLLSSSSSILSPPPPLSLARLPPLLITPSDVDRLFGEAGMDEDDLLEEEWEKGEEDERINFSQKIEEIVKGQNQQPQEEEEEDENELDDTVIYQEEPPVKPSKSRHHSSSYTSTHASSHAPPQSSSTSIPTVSSLLDERPSPSTTPLPPLPPSHLDRDIKDLQPHDLNLPEIEEDSSAHFLEKKEDDKKDEQEKKDKDSKKGGAAMAKVVEQVLNAATHLIKLKKNEAGHLPASLFSTLYSGRIVPAGSIGSTKTINILRELAIAKRRFADMASLGQTLRSIRGERRWRMRMEDETRKKAITLGLKIGLSHLNTRAVTPPDDNMQPLSPSEVWNRFSLQNGYTSNINSPTSKYRRRIAVLDETSNSSGVEQGVDSSKSRFDFNLLIPNNPYIPLTPLVPPSNSSGVAGSGFTSHPGHEAGAAAFPEPDSFPHTLTQVPFTPTSNNHNNTKQIQGPLSRSYMRSFLLSHLSSLLLFHDQSVQITIHELDDLLDAFEGASLTPSARELSIKLYRESSEESRAALAVLPPHSPLLCLCAILTWLDSIQMLFKQFQQLKHVLISQEWIDIWKREEKRKIRRREKELARLHPH